MKSNARVLIGFLLGCVMSALAPFLAGFGHGTYAPMAFNSSVLLFIPGIGVVLAFLAAPLLWAVYYGMIPAIQKLRVRAAVVSAVLLSHVLPGVWMVCTEPAFRSAFRLMRFYLLAYLFIAAVAVVGLVAVSRMFGQSHDQGV